MTAPTSAKSLLSPHTPTYTHSPTLGGTSALPSLRTGARGHRWLPLRFSLELPESLLPVPPRSGLDAETRALQDVACPGGTRQLCPPCATWGLRNPGPGVSPAPPRLAVPVPEFAGGTLAWCPVKPHAGRGAFRRRWLQWNSFPAGPPGRGCRSKRHRSPVANHGFSGSARTHPQAPQPLLLSLTAPRCLLPETSFLGSPGTYSPRAVFGCRQRGG